MLEYRAWGPSRRKIEDEFDPPFPPIRVPVELANVLLVDSGPASARGSASKHFDNFFDKVFLGWDSKLLSPADLAATADWLDAWAAEADRDPRLAGVARAVAERMRSAADADWYAEWDI